MDNPPPPPHTPPQGQQEQEQEPPPPPPEDLEGTGTAENLEAPRDVNEIVFRIEVGGEVHTVTRKAKESMSMAQDAMANRPTTFYKCQHAMIAVCDILEVDFLEYTMPKSKEELNSIDWENVDPLKMDTWPVAEQPSSKDFERVRLVHKIVKDEKDELAKSKGIPKSDVQSYISYKQRWKQFRDFGLLYHAMNLQLQKKTILDIMTIKLKYCTSLEKIQNEIAKDIKSHKNRLNKEKAQRQRQKELENQLAAIANEEEEAKAEIEKVDEELVAIQEQQQEIENVPLGRTRGSSTEQAKAIAEKRAQEEATRKKLEEAKCKQKEKEKARLDLQKRKNDAAAPPPPPSKVKRLKRNDTTLLNQELKPREKALSLGDAWLPPIRDAENRTISYLDGGSEWVKLSIQKSNLLIRLAAELATEQLIDQSLQFHTFLSFIGVDEDDFEFDMDFDDRVFLYVVALILHQER